MGNYNVRGEGMLALIIILFMPILIKFQTGILFQILKLNLKLSLDITHAQNYISFFVR